MPVIADPTLSRQLHFLKLGVSESVRSVFWNQSFSSCPKPPQLKRNVFGPIRNIAFTFANAFANASV